MWSSASRGSDDFGSDPSSRAASRGDATTGLRALAHSRTAPDLAAVRAGNKVKEQRAVMVRLCPSGCEARENLGQAIAGTDDGRKT